MRKTLVVIMIVVAVTAGAWDFTSYEVSADESMSMQARGNTITCLWVGCCLDLKTGPRCSGRRYTDRS